MTQVAKYPILGLNQDDDDLNLPVGFCREIHNALPKQAGLSKPGGIQNVPGTTLRSNGSLPAGNNTCIGCFEDKRSFSRLIYFLYNSLGNHSIWYYQPLYGTHTLVLQSSNLGFVSGITGKIVSCDIIEDTLVWCDGFSNEPRCIRIEDAFDGVYTDSGTLLGDNILEGQISIERPHPRIPPTAVKGLNVAFAANNICSDSWQFAIQFVYLDNTVSMFSPTSKLVTADTYPDPTAIANNKITVTFGALQADAIRVVKTIRFAYTKNNSGTYYVFKETDPATLTVDFYNNGPVTIVDDGERRQVNFVPRNTNNIVIHGQRVFATMDFYDYPDDSGATSFTLTNAAHSSGTLHHLPGTSVTYALVYFDKFMRTNGVVQKRSIAIPRIFATGNVEVDTASMTAVNWTIGGIAPSWARYYAIVRKKNDTISSYFTSSALTMFYKKEGEVPAAGEVSDDSKIYYQDRQNNWNRNITLKIANNVPVSLDNTYRVRILSNVGQSRETEPIININGDKVTCGNFGITNWGSVTSYFIVRFEKYNSVDDGFFYEIGEVYTITGSAHNTTTGKFYGDQHQVTFNNFEFEPVESGTLSYYHVPPVPSPPPNSGYAEAVILSQSPTTSAATTEARKTTIEKVKDTKKQDLIELETLGIIDFNKNKTTETITSEAKQTFTMDYNKIANDNGRAWVEVLNKKENYESCSISISDKYVFNSQINGINMFTNLYALPINRTPIRRLINVGASNILLAIHERTTTSLASYSGNVLHTSDGGQIVGDGNSIIGYDRELAGGYGTIYPESVVEHNGRVYWFDPYSGEVCRYAANGITPIGSAYKMRTYFTAKGKTFLDYTSRNVIGGFDPNLNIYYLTFISDDTSENETIAFIDRPGEERWISFFDFIPEKYGKVENRLFSFVDGELWEHNVSATYNSFHGVPYPTSIRHVFNTDYAHPKILRNISTESTSKWAFTSITTRDQETKLVASKFVNRDDQFYADVMRDMNTFGLSSSAGLTRGDILIGKTYEVELENEDTELTELSFINYGHQPAPGHKIV